MKSFSWLFMRIRTLRERDDRLHRPKVTAGRGNNRKQSADHTGRVFPTFRAMCEAWGVSPGLVRVRISQMGWSLRCALTTPALKRSQWHAGAVNWYHPDVRAKIRQERDRRKA